MAEEEEVCMPSLDLDDMIAMARERVPTIRELAQSLVDGQHYNSPWHRRGERALEELKLLEKIISGEEV